MARRPRLELPGIPLHVIQRGNNRALCFLTDADRRLYLACLARSAKTYACDVHAYVLMPNHVHLLATPSFVGGIAAMMQDIGRRYVRLFNEAHKRTGTLWEGRYKSSLVDTERYFLTCHRYIELNPVRAGIARNAYDYEWSSHRHYLHGERSALLRRHPIFERLGRNEDERREAFRAFFRLPTLEDELALIRLAGQKGRPLATPEFLNHLDATLGVDAHPPKIGRPAKKRESKPSRSSQEMLI